MALTSLVYFEVLAWYTRGRCHSFKGWFLCLRCSSGSRYLEGVAPTYSPQSADPMDVEVEPTAYVAEGPGPSRADYHLYLY